MQVTALVTACLVAVALAGPVPQGPYLVRPPQNHVSLHTVARQRNLNSAPQQQQFVVRLDSHEDSREDAILSLQGVGNFASAAAQAPVAPSIRTQQGPPQSFNIDGGAQFNVEIDHDSGESVELRLSSVAAPLECPPGQLRHGSRCVVPRINRNIFVFGKDEPAEQKSIDSVELPLPQLDYNIIFVRSRAEKQRKPVIVPPPQKKTVVYVLEDEVTDKDLIEVPAYPDADPEVYYVKVRPGENPQLPGGLDLETAYSQAIRPSDSLENSFESSIELNIGAGAAHSDAGQVAFGGSAQGTASFNSADAGFSSGGDFGVPLPASSDNRDDQGFNGGGASFDSGSNAFSGGDAGFDSVSNAGFDSGSNAGFDAGFDSGSNAFSGGNAGFDSGSNTFPAGNAGFDSGSNAFSGGNAGFDSISTSFNGGNAGFDAGFSSSGNSANSGSVGVPLPEFRGDNFNVNSNSGSGAGAGFDTGFSGNAGNSQTFSGNAQFTAETSFGNGQGFNSNIDFAAKGLSVEIDDGVVKVEASSDEVVRPALRYKLPRSG